MVSGAIKEANDSTEECSDGAVADRGFGFPGWMHANETRKCRYGRDPYRESIDPRLTFFFRDKAAVVVSSPSAES